MADNLRGLAAKRGLKYTEIAALTGIHPVHVKRLLSKETKMNVDAAHIFAHHLGTDVVALVAASLEDVPDLPTRADEEEERAAIGDEILREAIGRGENAPKKPRRWKKD